MIAITFVGLGELMDYFEDIKVAQKKVKIAFENADSSSRVELIPSRIKIKCSSIRKKSSSKIPNENSFQVVIYGKNVEYPKNPSLGAGASETKNPKKTSQAPKGYSVGPKMAFKPNQEYKPVTKKQTDNSRGNKMKVMVSTSKNVENSSTNTTPSMDKIDKFEDLIIDGQAILVDETGNPLNKVEYPGDHDGEDEVASIDNDMARSLAFERIGFGTKSLLEQWTDSYGNGDCDDDPYDDDMYEGQDLSEEIQTICDKLDIRV
uniref:Uncharacterized protein n=1 Tax=Tanacetum cinerariifolium TaxID=118510 RepID=A0A699HKA5_TANCI|nr:hypothetical protein [Tanacetum cinerariifolium]